MSVMDVNSNITGVYAEPGFHPEARYEFKVHFDGADLQTLIYRFSFGEPDADVRQALRLHALTGAEAREDSADGELVLESRTGETAEAGGPRLDRARRRGPLHRPVPAGHCQRGGREGDRGAPVGLVPAGSAEHLRRHLR